MPDDLASLDRLHGLDREAGPETRDLVVSGWRIRIAGLDAALASGLERRWGGFLERPSPPRERPRLVLRAFDAGERGWLPRARPGEIYRLEARNDERRRLVVSYHFALCPDGAGTWRLGLTAQAEEPPERVVENAVRFLVALLAAEDGGFAMHAAGVMHEGRAYLFAGPSGSGKTTVTRLARPAVSLGDDFAAVLPDAGAGWVAPGMPFDNAERAAPEPERGPFPVAGIWRLDKSDETAVERPPDALAAASLLACVAMPWAMPERAGALLDHVGRFVAGGGFATLRFTRDAALWTHLL